MILESIKIKNFGGYKDETVVFFDDLTTFVGRNEIGKPLFNKYTKKIDNHAFRREYVKERYVEILDGREDFRNYRGFDKKYWLNYQEI